MLRQLAAECDWENLKNNDINIYTSNVTNEIINISKKCILNRKILVRENDPPWLKNDLRVLIRKRKRLYRIAKVSNLPRHWAKFRPLRNQITTLIREAKKTHFDKQS
jgi:hypothetical protein